MRLRSIIGTAAAASTLVMTGVVTAGPASAAVLPCGSTVTQDTTLTANVGPCAGGDGLVVTTSNITLNLNKFKVIGKKHAGDAAGIRLANVTGVTVKAGTVQGFDAGVGIFDGSGNTVTNLTVKDNINDFQGGECELGDGISMTDSSNNTISTNRVVNSGPFGGISLIGNSDGNQINGNNVVGSNIHGIGCGNSTQDEGIRIEGPGANNNTINANIVTKSLLGGISLHGNVGCTGVPLPPGVIAGPPNTDNSITNNTVTATSGSTQSDGIKALAQGPFGTVVCAAFRNTFVGNNSSNNARNGINLPSTSVDNIVNDNTVNANGTPGVPAAPGVPAIPAVGDGIRLGGPIVGNRFTNVGPTVFNVVTPPGQPALVEGTDFATLPGSGTGSVINAPVVAVGAIDITSPGFDTSTSGCTAADFVGFPSGAVALIQRGFCDRTTKVANAFAAGASAVIFFNEGSPGREGLLVDGVGAQPKPVIGTSFAVGANLFTLTQSGPVTVNISTVTSFSDSPGAEHTILTNNKGFNNLEHDGHDANPDCDANVWTANKFGTVNQPCVKANGGTGQVKP